MSVEEALKFCKELETVHNEDGDVVKKLSEIHDMLKDYNYIKDRYYKYEYVCNMMSSDEYYELASKYEAESEDDEDEVENAEV